MNFLQIYLIKRVVNQITYEFLNMRIKIIRINDETIIYTNFYLFYLIHSSVYSIIASKLQQK